MPAENAPNTWTVTGDTECAPTLPLVNGDLTVSDVELGMS